MPIWNITLTPSPPIPPEVRAKLLLDLGLPDTALDEEVYAALGKMIVDFAEALTAAIVELGNPQVVALIRRQIKLSMDWKLLLESRAAHTGGWERLTEEVEMDDGEIGLDVGDWVWRDAEGRIRRTYGWAGGSYQRAHTFDENGACVVGVEVRDDPDVPAEDLDDPACIHPKWRASVEKYRIEAW